MPQIHTIEIEETGETKITVKGIKGKSCRDATRLVEEALGRKTMDLPTAEMHENATQKATH